MRTVEEKNIIKDIDFIDYKTILDIIFGYYENDLEKCHFIIDCDGIISDNKSYCDKNGKALKAYGCYDKEIINYLKYKGIKISFVSSDKQGYEITKNRIDHLNCDLYNYNAKERFEFVKSSMLDDCYTVFIGDSLSDIPTLQLADFSCTIKLAPQIVKNECRFVSDLNGGEGGLADCLCAAYMNLLEKK